nr:uncharacterized protein LOC105334137 [Crassostrea gigas]
MNIRGNRFNVCFYNAAGTFFIHKLLLQYILSSKSSFNFVQNVIVLSLQNKCILTILRALGILCKLLTGPYWLKTMEVNNILSMGSVFKRFLHVLDLCAKEPILALRQKIRLFEGPELEDTVSEFLFTYPINDDLTCVFIKRLCVVLKTKVEKLFADFLKDGKYFNVQKNLDFKCSSCPTSNICVEQLMDRLIIMYNHPQCHQIIPLYINNKTSEWFNNKSEEEKEKITVQTMKKTRTFMTLEKHRKQTLFRKHLTNLKEKQEDIKRKKKKKEDELDKVIDHIREEGLWDTESKIDSELQKIKTKKDRLSSLKKQINIHKKVFQISKQHKHLLNFSKKGKLFDEGTLRNNLLMLMNLRKENTETPVCETSFSPMDLLSREIIHTWSEDGEDVQWEGKILSHANGVFKVLYWNDKEKTDSSVFDLTEQEINKDIEDRNLFFKDAATRLDHSYI